MQYQCNAVPTKYLASATLTDTPNYSSHGGTLLLVMTYIAGPSFIILYYNIYESERWIWMCPHHEGQNISHMLISEMNSFGKNNN